MAWATGIAGLSLVGAGVYASGSLSHPRIITTQGLSVVLSANGATGNYTPNITLGSLGPTGSSFMTAPVLVTITNNGTIAASDVALQLSDRSNNTTFEHQTWVCLYSNGNIFANEPLTTVKGYGQSAIGNLTLAPGATGSYTVVYYAGTEENTGCGNAFTGYSATPYNGYPGQYNSTEPYPAGTTNSAALSLTNPVEGESITPTVTVSYVSVPGTITQIAPFGKSVTVANSGSGFGDQLAVSGSSGAVTYVVTSSNTHLKVSSSGAITTVGGPLAVGTYTVSGTDSDAFGDTGTWTYTLTVTKGTITQIAPFGQSKTVANTGSGFSDQLAVTGSSGAVTYVVTSSNTHLKVTSSGAITTVGGPLAVGTYTVSGTDSDALGDTGTWTYTLTVTKGTITCTGSHGGEVHWSHWGDFNDQLSETGAHGTPTYTITSADDHLHVSSDGRITTDGGPLAPGTYTISGNCKDSYGDSGNWSYTLTVSK